MIFDILKRKRRNKAGEVVLSKSYYLRYRIDPMPRDKFVCLNTSDKSVAQGKGRDYFEYEQKVNAGMVPSREVLEQKALPLTQHVEEFCAELAAMNRSAAYVYNSEKSLLKLFKKMRWLRLADITAEGFEKWRRENNKLSSKTLNDYMTLLSGFMLWHVRHKRIASNPMASVQKMKPDAQKRRARRALSFTELEALTKVDDYRGTVYLVAAYTGIRRTELAKLQWRDIDFEVGCVRLRASTTKNGKDATLALNESVLIVLKSYKSQQGAIKLSDVVFDVIPSVPVLKGDLKRCGIAYQDEFGRFADFHALRHTFCTMLASSGVSQRVAQSLMRHSDAKLTANIYTDENLLPLQGAVEKLPSISKEWTQIRTQMDDKKGQNAGNPVASEKGNTEAVKSKKPLQGKGLVEFSHSLSQPVGWEENGRPTRARTWNDGIKIRSVTITL